MDAAVAKTLVDKKILWDYFLKINFQRSITETSKVMNTLIAAYIMVFFKKD